MPLNAYGDKVIPTTGRHGSDISSQRMDDLDLHCLSFVKARVGQGAPFLALDIGGGKGAQSMRMAKEGANVLFVDLTDRSADIAAFNATLGREAIRFMKGDVRSVDAWPESIGCVYSQRMLNYLPYCDALRLLMTLRTAVAFDAPFFLSSGGLHTEYGKTYEDRDKLVKERFGYLSPEMARKHAIASPVCLYSEEELRSLAEEAGLKIDRSWTSPFGNPKVIAMKEAQRK